jgi:hypothetical protein
MMIFKFPTIAFTLIGLVSGASSFSHASEAGVEVIHSTLRTNIIDGVGSYKVRVDNYGEPSSLPLRISVDLRCGMAENSTRVFEDLTACGFVSFGQKGKDLVLELKVADPQSEKCSVAQSVKVTTASVCSLKKK